MTEYQGGSEKTEDGSFFIMHFKNKVKNDEEKVDISGLKSTF